ncbi:hypothetical protein AOA12_10535 [Microbacterium sp. No. 7]|nr:hypothetical protein AOA12_10535 [Microbacterium sp. No. 7]
MRLSAIMGRNRFTKEPGPVVAELIEAAGERTEILRSAVGRWIGSREDRYTVTLATALREAFGHLGLEDAIRLGQERAAAPVHTSQGFHRD